MKWRWNSKYDDGKREQQQQYWKNNTCKNNNKHAEKWEWTLMNYNAYSRVFKFTSGCNQLHNLQIEGLYMYLKENPKTTYLANRGAIHVLKRKPKRCKIQHTKLHLSMCRLQGLCLEPSFTRSWKIICNWNLDHVGIKIRLDLQRWRIPTPWTILEYRVGLCCCFVVVVVVLKSTSSLM